MDDQRRWRVRSKSQIKVKDFDFKCKESKNYE